MRTARPLTARLAPPRHRAPRRRVPAPPSARRAAAAVEQVPYLFVPDISQQDPAGAAAALAMVKDMSLGEIAARGVLEIALCYGVAAAAVKLLRKCTDMADKDAADVSAKRPSMLRVAADAAVGAALAPSRVVLPAAATFQTARTIALVAQIILKHEMAVVTPGTFPPAVRAAATRLASLLSSLDTAFLDAAQLAVVLFVAWFVLAWKDRLVAAILRRADAARLDSTRVAGEAGLERILIPFAGLASWAVVAAALVAGLGVMGVDPRPLLTVGGVGGLAVGFGAQSVTSNAISGLQLYVTRPFVVGERVTLQTQTGAPVATGVVERIDPMRTVVRSDKGVPLSLPNRAVTEYIVLNESRVAKSRLLADFAGPRHATTRVEVRLEDLDRVPALTAAVTAWLAAHPDVDKRLPHGASVAGTTPWSITVGAAAYTTPAGTRRFGAFQADLIREALAAVEAAGCACAVPP